MLSCAPMRAGRAREAALTILAAVALAVVFTWPLRHAWDTSAAWIQAMASTHLERRLGRACADARSPPRLRRQHLPSHQRDAGVLGAQHRRGRAGRPGLARDRQSHRRPQQRGVAGVRPQPALDLGVGAPPHGSARRVVVGRRRVCVLPYAMSHLAHIQLLMSFGVPLALLGLHWLVLGCRSPAGGPGHGPLAAGISCGYYGILAGLAVGLARCTTRGLVACADGPLLGSAPAGSCDRGCPAAAIPPALCRTPGCARLRTPARGLDPLVGLVAFVARVGRVGHRWWLPRLGRGARCCSPDGCSSGSA